MEEEANINKTLPKLRKSTFSITIIMSQRLTTTYASSTRSAFRFGRTNTFRGRIVVDVCIANGVIVTRGGDESEFESELESESESLTRERFLFFRFFLEPRSKSESESDSDSESVARRRLFFRFVAFEFESESVSRVRFILPFPLRSAMCEGERLEAEFAENAGEATSMRTFERFGTGELTVRLSSHEPPFSSRA